MAKPTLLAVDDDDAVLRAVEQDLRSRYADRYRILRAESGAAALETLDQLAERGDAVALILTDQRMPQMSGVELLEEARRRLPTAKRVLLTAYADTDAAIRAVNSAQIDYYMVKPWDPPDERFYPVLDDLLEDWEGSYRPPFSGIYVVGQRWSAASHRLRDFLAGHQAPFRWVDADSDEGRRRAAEAGQESAPLPLIFFPEGDVLAQPDIDELAARLGLQTQARRPFYDLIIVGAGPAGLAAAVYGASEGLSTLLVERRAPGGQAGESSRIENYLGFPNGLSGADLARRALAQVRRFHAEVLSPQEVTGLRRSDPYRTVELADGSEIGCYAMLIATGVEYRTLNAPGLERLQGAGVFYGSAMTEAPGCADQTVVIVGAANSAGQAALYFAEHAGRVVLVCRGDDLGKSMSAYLVERIGKTEAIDVRLHTEVAEGHGAKSLEAVTLRNSQTGECETIPAAALFVFIGAAPRTEWLAGLLDRDKEGYILTGRSLRRGGRPHDWGLDRDPYLLETCVPGLFAAGDVRSQSVKRIASAVGEGSMAVQFVHNYLADVRG